MENIDQLAIILGHEIAHAVMGHAVSASLEQDFTFSYHFYSKIEILPTKLPKLHIYNIRVVFSCPHASSFISLVAWDQ